MPVERQGENVWHQRQDQGLGEVRVLLTELVPLLARVLRCKGGDHDFQRDLSA